MRPQKFLKIVFFLHSISDYNSPSIYFKTSTFVLSSWKGYREVSIGVDPSRHFHTCSCAIPRSSLSDQLLDGVLTVFGKSKPMDDREELAMS